MSKKNKTLRVKLIANPGSGTGVGRGSIIEQVTRSLNEQGVKVDVAIAKPKEKAIPIAKKAVREGYKIIIAMGGDDTVEAVIRGMAGSKSRLAIIPVGTANDVAKSLGIPENIEENCALIVSGKFRKLDLGQVRVKGQKKKKMVFFELVTLGISAALYPDALHASKGKKPLASIKGALQTILTHETRPKVTVKMDGGSSVTVESMLAIVSNTPLIGPKMLIVPDALMDDGLFDIALFPNFNKAELLAYTTRTLNTEKPADDGKIQRYRASKITITSKPKLEVLADGVMLGKGKTKIRLLPYPLRVIAPEVGAGVEKPPEAAGADLPAPVAPAVKEPDNPPIDKITSTIMINND
jgi:diacylglycerol kinase (ATP)